MLGKKDEMMKEIALITLHGMGEKDETPYYTDLEVGLIHALGDDWDRVSFQNVNYASVFQNPQNDLWGKIINEPSNDIDMKELRKFFLFGFGDAGSLEASAHGNKVEYLAVQECIQMALKCAFVESDHNPDIPVVIIAHSLGCQVISNYLWDASKHTYIFKDSDSSNEAESRFLKLGSLRNLITTGCNIPLFIGGIRDPKSFQPPESFEWDNYYDADDVLGWPLRQLGSSYEYINDHAINSGGLFTSWNPLCHNQYWSDRDIIQTLSDKISLILNP